MLATQSSEMRMIRQSSTINTPGIPAALACATSPMMRDHRRVHGFACEGSSTIQDVVLKLSVEPSRNPARGGSGGHAPPGRTNNVVIGAISTFRAVDLGLSLLTTHSCSVYRGDQDIAWWHPLYSLLQTCEVL